MSANEIRKCEYCGEDFPVVRVNQKYCSNACRLRYVYRLAHPDVKPYKMIVHSTCSRFDCALYTDKYLNHCLGLSDVPVTNECKFYKSSEE